LATTDKIEQMIAVVCPERHLSLRMMQRMQRPPPIELMLPSVNQVVNKIENNKVQQETDPSNVRDTWPKCVNVKSWKPVHAQHAKRCFNGIFKSEKHDQLKKAQTVNQGVEDINFDTVGICHRFRRSPFFQGRNEDKQNQNLQQAN
jgi:hypothetical protein